MTDTDIDASEQLTEQIEARVGNISVYVSGTETEDVKETFEDVWETVIEDGEEMMERAESAEERSTGSGKTFGD